MIERYELHEWQWQLIRDLFPPPKATGRNRRDPRQMLDAILWILCCGAPWRDLPERYGHWNTTLLSSMTVEGMGPSLGVEGATDREVFEAYIEKMLAPCLQAEQVVVMDNLSAHKGERVRELVEERGAELLYLPPYSPDLNPIEEARRSSVRLRSSLTGL